MKREEVLEKAKEIATKDRNETYGMPEDSFDLIAKLWSAYLGKTVEPFDVALTMGILKIARLRHSRGNHPDSWIDLAGYAACGAECSEEINPEPYFTPPINPNLKPGGTI